MITRCLEDGMYKDDRGGGGGNSQSCVVWEYLPFHPVSLWNSCKPAADDGRTSSDVLKRWILIKGIASGSETWCTYFQCRLPKPSSRMRVESVSDTMGVNAASGNVWKCFDFLELSVKISHFYSSQIHSGSAAQRHQGVALSRCFDRQGYQSSLRPYSKNG